MFVNVVAIGWNSYLSWLNSKGAQKRQQQLPQEKDQGGECKRSKIGESEEYPSPCDEEERTIGRKGNSKARNE